ncbi:MAG: hypothetical protein KatS3mg102_0770 [Planctomycetota bacterium]|nr:MAG: hypothetical protein KatS3mg102_0770 [Planctomycetota bacterium]
MAAEIERRGVRAGPERSAGPRHKEITRSLLEHALGMAAEFEAAAIFVYVEGLPREHWQVPERFRTTFYFVAKTDEEAERIEQAGMNVIRAPNVRLTRMGQVKLAILLALAQGLLEPGDVILCLAGITHSGTLDTLVVMEVGSEFELFMAPSGQEVKSPEIRPEVLVRVIDIALDLSAEGREGKPVGALFVIGDAERVQALSRQLILNPFHGYPPEQRNVLDARLVETIKELSTIDGAFVIRGDGEIVSAGTYLMTHALPAEELPPGLGARHQAAAGITAVTDAIAVAVSESTGTVTVFRQGRPIIQIERGHRSKSAAEW